MIELLKKCIRYFQEHPSNFITFHDLCVKMNVSQKELTVGMQHLVRLSIIKQEDFDGILKYQYNHSKEAHSKKQ